MILSKLHPPDDFLLDSEKPRWLNHTLKIFKNLFSFEDIFWFIRPFGDPDTSTTSLPRNVHYLLTKVMFENVGNKNCNDHLSEYKTDRNLYDIHFEDG